MNAGKVLIGMALLVISVALMITPSGAAPQDAFPPVGGVDAYHAGSNGDFPSSYTSAYGTGYRGEFVSAISHPHAHLTSMLSFRTLHHVPCLLFDRLGMCPCTGNGGVCQ